MSTGPRNDAEDYQGFSLNNVVWGYRQIFETAIEELRSEGLLGAHRSDVTDRFFGFLKEAKRSCFDHVLKEFLEALNPRNRWIMDVPEIFSGIVTQGKRFAESKIHYGTSYFKALAEGGFGDTPKQVQHLIKCLDLLAGTDEDLALAFMRGYRRLVEHLRRREVEHYLHEGLRLHARNKQSGCKFMEGALKSCDVIIRTLSKESRLHDARGKLEKLLRSLTGDEVEVADLGHLDSDELIERGTRMVCMYRWLYLPARVRDFESLRLNQNWHLLQTIVAAGMLSEDSFPRIHGHPDYATCRDLVGDSLLAVNLFQIVEYARVLRRIKQKWPGACKLIDFGIDAELNHAPPGTDPDRLFFEAVRQSSGAGEILPLVEESRNCFDTASQLGGGRLSRLVGEYPELGTCLLRTFGFLPDFLYPGSVQSPPSDSLIADLKEQAEGKPRHEDEVAEETKPGGDGEADQSDEEQDGVAAAFLYDEWSEVEHDYYADYCFLREVRPPDCEHASVVIPDQAREVRKVFERIKPELARKEKYLEDGDFINHDLLVEYLVKRREEPSPDVNFHETPLIKRRDLAVLLLLDVSGSTSDDVGTDKVIEIEKNAALILGQGLASLDDRFAICGFSGNGRKNCEYFVFKDFDDPWDEVSMRRIALAHPRASTRMGPPLRHAGYRLSRIAAKQRLIILITDGKPQDSEYDPSTQYAQHDVRMACLENRRQDIHTFCISTEDNTCADLETMFPNRRYVTLKSIGELPEVLPKLYLRLTN